jgi:hypothetical protein
MPPAVQVQSGEEPAAEAIRREARAHALSDAGSGPEVARRIYDACVEGQHLRVRSPA